MSVSTKLETIIAVKDFPLSSEFYDQLLAFKSEHRGDTFEILTSENSIVECLHKWGSYEIIEIKYKLFL